MGTSALYLPAYDRNMQKRTPEPLCKTPNGKKTGERDGKKVFPNLAHHYGPAICHETIALVP